MNAPLFYGIDPDATYRFTPSAFRENPEGMDAELREAHDAAKDGTDRMDRLTEIYRKYAGKHGPAKPGAPVLLLGPLSERLSLRLQAARTMLERKRALSLQRFSAKVKEIRAGEGEPDAKAAQIAQLEEKEREEHVDRSLEAYDPDLQFAVLESCVRGWENIKAKWSGKWERDAKALPREWKEEAFLAILDESAFSPEDAVGFTSGPDSAPS